MYAGWVLYYHWAQERYVCCYVGYDCSAFGEVRSVPSQAIQPLKKSPMLEFVKDNQKIN